MNQSAERQQAPELGPLGAVAALADSALDQREAEIAIDLLLNSAELRGAWDELHWIGDCLRSDETGALVARRDFMSRFHSVLAAEPTVLAPPRTAAPRRWLRYGVPATAAVMVSAVVWMAHPLGNGALVASDAASAGAGTVQVLAPAATRAVVDPAQLNEYLAAHREFSSTGLHGPGAIQAASFNIVADGGRDRP